MQRDEGIGDDEGPQHDRDGARPAGATEPEGTYQPEDDGDGGGERPILLSAGPEVVPGDIVGGVQDGQNSAQERHQQDGQRLEFSEVAHRVTPGDDGGRDGQGTGRQQRDQHTGNRKALMFRVNVDFPGCRHEVTRGNHPEFDKGDQTGSKHGEPETTPGEIQTDQPDKPDQPAHGHVDDVDVGAAEFMNQVEAAQRDGQQPGGR